MILVVGVTGSTGQSVVRELTQRGVKVRATARDMDKARAALQAAGAQLESVELVSCDLERPETCAAALKGVERCYVAVGGPTGTPHLVDVARRFIDAAKRAGVVQYVHVSGIRARPTGASKIEKMHGTIAEHLIGSGMGWTVLEPSFFMQNFFGLMGAIRGGVLPMPAGDGKAGLIDARDIGAVGAAVLTSDGHLGGRYELTGPELLGHADVAATMSGVLEWPVQYQPVPAAGFEQSLVGAGLPPWFANLLTDVYAELYAPGRAAILSPEVERITGRAPRSLSTFLRDHRAVLAAGR